MARLSLVFLIVVLIHSCCSRLRLDSECGSYETECLQALIEKVEYVQRQVEQITSIDRNINNDTDSLSTVSRQQLAAFQEYVKSLQLSLFKIQQTDESVKDQLLNLNLKLDLLTSKISATSETPQSSVLLGLVSLIVVILFGILLSLNCAHCKIMAPTRPPSIERQPLINDVDEEFIPPPRLELDESSSDYECQPPDVESLQLSPVSSRRE